MKEYEQTVSEEDAYEAKYKTGYETPVRTNQVRGNQPIWSPFFSKLGTNYPQFGVLYG
jgi:hypothetical protein